MLYEDTERLQSQYVKTLWSGGQCCLQGDADLQVTVQQQTSELAVLREQCSNHAKERAALKTILDAKIKALVDDIGHSVAEAPQEVCSLLVCSMRACSSQVRD